jgi:hypothetical protein
MRVVMLLPSPAFTEQQVSVLKWEKKEIVMGESHDEGTDVVLRGTVIETRPVQGRDPHQKWLVTLQVDSVVAGCFSGHTLSFSIHSPTKSGIAVGGRYEIHATRPQTGEYLLKSIKPSED